MNRAGAPQEGSTNYVTATGIKKNRSGLLSFSINFEKSSNIGRRASIRWQEGALAKAGSSERTRSSGPVGSRRLP
jgi:hypothetical protein